MFFLNYFNKLICYYILKEKDYLEKLEFLNFLYVSVRIGNFKNRIIFCLLIVFRLFFMVIVYVIMWIGGFCGSSL